jgi:hypothetical protein
MVKASLLLMAVLTILVAMGLRWRDQRLPGGKPQPGKPRMGWIAAQKAKANRWVTAAAIAAIGTTVILGGLHWLKLWQG